MSLILKAKHHLTKHPMLYMKYLAKIATKATYDFSHHILKTE